MSESQRLPLVASADEQLREILAKTLMKDGQPLNIFRLMGHHPLLLRRFNAMGGALLTGGELPPRVRELAILRMAWRTGSVYEFGQHTIIGRHAGLKDVEIHATTLAEIPDDWSADERHVIDMVDDIYTSDSVSDACWEALAQRWTAKDLVELVLLAGYYRMVSIFLKTFRVQREPGVPGWPDR
jgi:4-carboxymuconolactone decarboxylase